MAKSKIKSPLEMRHGISASRVWLPKNINEEGQQKWESMLAFLVERFPFIDKTILEERMLRHDIVDQTGRAYLPDSDYQGEIFLFYYREIPDEPKIPFNETILFKNNDFIVVDKPHFIPVTPTGRYVRESLLARLKHQFQNEDISPVHRLDRETAGIVLFTCKPDVRGAYQSLFQKREVSKTYHAIATSSSLEFPLTHQSRIVKSDPFFIMQEDSEAKSESFNSETTINIKEKKGNLAKYELKPITGRQHQLRVHMMSLGIPILNDPFYPKLMPCKGEDYSKPLQLLAKKIAFIDPINGERRSFKSKLRLTFPHRASL